MKKLGDNKVLLFVDKTKSERVLTVSVHHRLRSCVNYLQQTIY